MKTILLYPAFSDASQSSSVFARLYWYFAPYNRHIEAIRVSAPFPEITVDLPYFIDKAAIASPASLETQNKVQILQTDMSQQDWIQAIDAADIVLLWQLPESTESDPFVSLGNMQKIFGHKKVFAVDEVRLNNSSSNMMLAALSLISDQEELLADSKRKLKTFKERITLPAGYVFGTGPSLEEARRYDYSDGHTIVCNSIVKNTPLLDKLNPIALMAGDPIFHAGPSTYASAFRKHLIDSMQDRDFHVFVPWRDYAIYLTYLPKDLHERIIGVPLQVGDAYNLNIEKKFAVLALPNVLTLLLLPIAATFFDHVGISGCDGRPLSQDSYFWGHHKASQFGDQMEAIQLAHPGFFSISYNDYYMTHCAEVERLCHEMECLGKSVEAVTASFIPALRKRGAAEPMQPPRGDASVDPVVLSLAPDLKDRSGRTWAQERLLSAKVQAGGLPYWLSANASWAQDKSAAAGDNEPAMAAISRVTCNFTNGSDRLAKMAKERPAHYWTLQKKVRGELRNAVESALLATEGRVHAYLSHGSFEQAALLYEAIRENPRLSAHVALHWVSNNEASDADFLQYWDWLLKAAKTDPRLTLVCVCKHQSATIQARSDISLPVAPCPSTLLDDDAAWRQLNTNRARQPEPKLYFAANDGQAWSKEQASALTAKIKRRLNRQTTDFVFDSLAAEDSDEALKVVSSAAVDALQDGSNEMERLIWLGDCQAIVLPHLPTDYADRQPDLVPDLAIESLYVGAPIVAQRGTTAAALVESYDVGVVIDSLDPDGLCHGLERLAAKNSSAMPRESAKAYHRRNSWQRLAQSIIGSLPQPETAPLVPVAVEEEKVPVPLIGPNLRTQQSDAREHKTLTSILAAMGVEIPLAGALEAIDGEVLQYLAPDGSGLLLTLSGAESEALSSSLQSLSQEQRATIARLDLAKADAAACHAALTSFLEEKAARKQGLLVVKRLSVAEGALSLLEAVQPLGALIAFDDDAGTNHGALAAALDAMGYLVLISERHPALHRGEAPTTWRIGVYPFLSDLPWASGYLMALPPNAPLRFVRHQLITCGDNMAYHDDDDPIHHNQEIWDRAQPVDQTTVLSYEEKPGGSWRPEAFSVKGTTDAGLVRFNESEATRVHRTYTGAAVEAGWPLTFSVDCAQRGRRFVMLWLSDKNNQPRAGAVFDLRTGTTVSTESQLSDHSIGIEAGSVQNGVTKDGSPIHRLWITVSAYPWTEEIMAQLLTRLAASGSRQHQGHPSQGFYARDILLERTSRPSRVR
ncbi:MAG: hypothetical protein GDA41_10760 [Rhodospirillales bacterium]|nr:hypothetical protein [Rhodospirillales bacterium]